LLPSNLVSFYGWSSVWMSLSLLSWH
jgi:hypothetical protein